MKSPEEIEARIRVRLGEELETRLKRLGARLPTHCVHNYRHSLDSRKVEEGEPNPLFNTISTSKGKTIGLCVLGATDPETWTGTVCEDPIDAQRCPYFTPIQDKAALLQEFKEQIQDITWLEREIPDIAPLVWVLAKTPKLHWWDLFKSFIFRVKLEPQIVTDLSKLLPGDETVSS